jgi:hypothetical protein
MTDEEIEAYRERLNDLTAKCSEERPESRIRQELKQLAREVGASTWVFYVNTTYGKGITGEADSSELIKNIHQALQTASMANMCRRAAESYQVAIEVSREAHRRFRIVAIVALVSAAAAWVGAIAAWVVAFRN